MVGGRNRLITLGVLFIAVLLAYRQRDAAKRAVVQNPSHIDTPTAFQNNPYYPPNAAQSHAQIPLAPPPPVGVPPTGGNPQSPPARVQATPPKKELPNEVFKLLTKIPSPLPLLYRSIIWTFHLLVSLILILSPLITVPLMALYNFTLTLSAPAITLVQALNYYLVLIPLGIAAAIGRMLYPLYVLAAAAVLFGGVVGAAGGWVHGGLVAPWSSGKSRNINEEVHRDIKQLVDGKVGVRREKGKGGARRGEAGGETEEVMSRRPGMTRVKEEELKGWRETVW